MEVCEIKKLFQKTSIELKKLSYDGICSINCRQQKNRTATILVGRTHHVLEGSLHEQHERVTQKYEEMIKLEPIQNFCELTKSTFNLDIINEGRHGKRYYIRFNY